MNLIKLLPADFFFPCTNPTYKFDGEEHSTGNLLCIICFEVMLLFILEVFFLGQNGE